MKSELTLGTIFLLDLFCAILALYSSRLDSSSSEASELFPLGAFILLSLELSLDSSSSPDDVPLLLSLSLESSLLLLLQLDPLEEEEDEDPSSPELSSSTFSSKSLALDSSWLDVFYLLLGSMNPNP
jgi:hypothetical protein